MLPLYVILSLAAVPASAQTVGGGSQTHHQWNGGTAFESLGASVSSAGDINLDGHADLIVGAPGADPNGLQGAGSVFVYSGADSSILYQWNGAAAADSFGSSVSCAGDVNSDGYSDLIVGAYTTDSGSFANVGTAYVYSGADGTLLYQWNGALASGQFGHSVSGAGDTNGDGFADVIIGARYSDVGSFIFAGSAFIYSGADGSLLHQWDGEASHDWFGASVSGAGDVNNDGYEDVIIGANGTDPGFLWSAGSAYVYSGGNGSLLYKWSGMNNSDLFGSSVSNAGDVDADGFADLIIGAQWANAGGLVDSGAAYVYSGANGSLIHQWNGEQRREQLGSAVSTAGDPNGDGFADLIIGSAGASSGLLTEVGSIKLISGADGVFIHQWTGEAEYDNFGAAVSAAGDVNGDGFTDLIIGASQRDSGGFIDAGSAVVYSFNPFMRANAIAISATTGGVINLNLDFPSIAGFDTYKVLISSSGIGPINYGVDIPLTLDSLLIDTYFGHYPIAYHNNLQGTLDANGDASASLAVLAGAPSSMVGTTYHLAAIANQLGQLPEYSSVALPILITP